MDTIREQELKQAKLLVTNECHALCMDIVLSCSTRSSKGLVGVQLAELQLNLGQGTGCNHQTNVCCMMPEKSADAIS